MTITLPVTKRDNAISIEELRAKGNVPAVVYGPKQEPIQIAVEEGVFDKVRKEAGESTIVNLDGLGESVEVLIKDIEFNAVKPGVVHVDFYAIERGKDMTVTVPIHYEGEAPAEKNNIGTVNRVLHEIQVTCRPSNLPSEIVVSIEGLVEADSQIHVSDLPALDGVAYDAEDDEVVAVVSIMKEEEPEEDAEAVDMDAIEVEQRGKEDTEEEA